MHELIRVPHMGPDYSQKRSTGSIWSGSITGESEGAGTLILQRMDMVLYFELKGQTP